MTTRPNASPFATTYSSRGGASRSPWTPPRHLGDGLRLAPTPGHTPGHTSLWIHSGGERAVVTGDLIHHPVLCAHPRVGRDCRR
ncbi:MAG: MBL fold metallo-hydrolase [Actinomycetota bacterium]|nr:MBL fold metallo-hydrolase [Actinomycetota bacterium]